MCVCMFMCEYVCMYVCMYEYIQKNVSIPLRTTYDNHDDDCAHAFVMMNVCISMYVCMYVCSNVRMSLVVRVCMYKRLCIYM